MGLATGTSYQPTSDATNTPSGNYGGFPAKLQPTQTKELYRGNYLDFFSSGFNQWSQQFLPDVYEKEIEIYGNRTVSGFLSMLSAEMPFSSDQVIWTEGGRLHARYTGGFFTTATSVPTIPTNNLTNSTVATDDHGHITISFPADQGGNKTISDLAFRVGQTVIIAVESDGTGDQLRSKSEVAKGVIVAVGTTSTNSRTLVASLYNPSVINATNWAADDTVTAFVYGSEFQKGSSGMTDAVFPEYNTYQNSPIIMKDHFGINGSDTSQIGWIEVTSESGGSGYLWYVKAEHENRMRWEDYMEMSMLEAVQAEDDAVIKPTTDVSGDINARNNAELRGTEGLFQALERRGNLYNDLSTELDATDNSTSSTDQFPTRLSTTFDTILKHLDKQGQIQENMLYVNRDLHLAFDNFLSYANNMGGGNTAGVSWGVFNNSDNMALKLGFSGFRRGSYDFYKTDWRYLNDWTTRGGLGDIEGLMLPAGSSTVYDQNAGVNVKRPFLHIRYRASEVENRKMKSWITGSVGGAYTNDIDEMRMHYLTERMLITQAANNFFILKNTSVV